MCRATPNEPAHRARPHRRRKRNWDEPRLQRSQECVDVVEPLWCQYHCPVSARCTMPELVRSI
jgi:hypothetical protein